MPNKSKTFLQNSSLTTIDYLLCAVLAFAFSASPYYMSKGDCTFSLAFCLSVVYIFLLLILCSGIIRKLLSKEEPLFSTFGALPEFVEKAITRPHHILGFAALIFICWLPALSFLYPGTLINDTWGQLNQYIIYSILKESLFDNHPVFDTLLMGFTIVPLSMRTGQWQMVIFGYVLLQAFATALVFSYTIDYVFYKLKLGSGAVLFVLLVYCILPLYPASVQTVSKDAIFSWIYTLYVVQITEFARTRGQSLNSKKSLISFTIITVLCCLTKKAGPLVVIPAYFIAWLVLQKNRNAFWHQLSFPC